MGDGQNEDLRVQFDRRLKLKFLGSQVTTDAGLLGDRELDEAFALTEMVQDTFEDSRIASNLKKLMEKSTCTRERQSSGRSLAGRYFGRSEPRNRGCGGENVKTSPRDRRGLDTLGRLDQSPKAKPPRDPGDRRRREETPAGITELPNQPLTP